MARTAAAKLYESDYYTWALTQAKALRRGCFKDLNLPNLVDEVEDMAKSQESELRSRLTVLLTHLLKWAYEPGVRSKSWRLTIKDQRLQLKELLGENPGMKPKAPRSWPKRIVALASRLRRRLLLRKRIFPALAPGLGSRQPTMGFGLKLRQGRTESARNRSANDGEKLSRLDASSTLN